MIRFLIDTDLPRSACIALRQRGYFADDVRDLDLGTATDDTVLQHATTYGYTLISGDKGFTNLVRCRLVSRIWPVSPLERPSPALPAPVPGRSPRPAADRRFPTSYSMNPKIQWTKDRGKEPESLRPKAQFPWFWKDGQFTGERVNDAHFTNADKRAAWERAAGARPC